MASPEQTSDYVPGGKPLTGRKVLLIMLAFFGVIITMNLGILMPNAIKTFRGLETDSAYRASQNFNADLAVAREMAARGWSVEAKVARGVDGVVVAEIAPRDAEGRVLPAMEGEATLARPADRRMDMTSPVALVGYGAYEARFENAPAGQWDIVITFEQDGERVFHSRNRIILR
jgi:nitrogen fixation protein FixH